jgi:hypothetical protein
MLSPRAPRLVLCVSGLLVAACAIGAGVWYARRGANAPPPLPDLPADWNRGERDADLALPQSEREFLWAVEHHGNVLNAYGFKQLAAALCAADTRALTAMLADEFRGELPAEARVVSVRNEALDVVRRDGDGQSPDRVGREAFVKHLLEYRRAYTARPPTVQLVVKTLLPKVRSDKEGPWQGLAQLRLYGESRPGQPCEVVVILRYEVARPTREALGHPGWLRTAGVQQSLVAHATHYLMAEVTKERGLDPAPLHDNWREDPSTRQSALLNTGGVFVCDFDRDGILDVLITDVNRNALYRGLPGGRFEDVTADMGLPRSPTTADPLSNAACWVDIDGDGWDDLILADRVFRNAGGKKFVDYTARTNLRLPPDTVGLAVADYDRDGKLDLYAVRTGSGTAGSWLDGHASPDAGNLLYRNRGDWQFEDVTVHSNTDAGYRSCFTALWLDANEDGWPDLYVTNEFGNGLLLENKGDGTFREHLLGRGPVDFGTMGAAAGDIDGDGHIDLYSADMYSKAGKRIIGNLPPEAYPDKVMARIRRLVAGSEVHLNRGEFRFDQGGEQLQVNAVGWAYGPVLADLDNDGWLDVYATSGHISHDRTKPDG